MSKKYGVRQKDERILNVFDRILLDLVHVFWAGQVEARKQNEIN